MTIEKVRDFFGIKYLIPYDIDTKKPLAVFRAIGEISYESSQDAIELVGGNSEAPYDVEYGQPSITLTGTIREYPAELYEILETSTITENSAEASGNISNKTNHQGTSIFGGSNGISNVTVHPSLLSSLVFGQHVLVATGAKTLDLHINGLTDSFLDMQAMVVEGISTTTAGAVQISAYGLTLTIVGTPNYTIGDTMAFDVRPVNTGSTQILVGTGTTPDSFGLRLIFPRKTDGVLHYIDLFNVSGKGLPWKAVSREFSEFDFTWKPSVRSLDNAIYQMVRVVGV